MASRIVFISKSATAASTRYRAHAFFPALEAAGWQVSHVEAGGGPTAKARMLMAARGADVVVVLRRTLSAPLRRMLRAISRRLVFEFDDAIFIGDDGQPSRTRQTGFDAMMRLCDQVWAGNSFLAEQAGRINSHVKLMPTVLDVGRYHVGTREQLVDGPIDLVWIGSSATRKYLEAATPTLSRAMSADARLRLKIITDFDLPDAGLNALLVQWSSEGEADELAVSHIGIAPMSDDIWTRGKCGFKVIQYMAAGLPVISSNVGANRDIVVPDATGLLVDDEAGWLAAIAQLASDAERRHAMGDAGRQRALDEYDLAPASRRMLSHLAELA